MTTTTKNSDDIKTRNRCKNVRNFSLNASKAMNSTMSEKKMKQKLKQNTYSLNLDTAACRK